MSQEQASITNALAYYAKASDKLLRLFCQKQDLQYDPDPWVASQPGTIACIADYWLSMDDIWQDLNGGIPKGEILKWYDYAVGNDKALNYRTWLMSRYPAKYPRPSLDELHRKADEARKALADSMDDTNPY